MIVAANKSDMADPKQIKRFRDYVENAGLPFYENFRSHDHPALRSLSTESGKDFSSFRL